MLQSPGDLCWSTIVVVRWLSLIYSTSLISVQCLTLIPVPGKAGHTHSKSKALPGHPPWERCLHHMLTSRPCTSPPVWTIIRWRSSCRINGFLSADYWNMPDKYSARAACNNRAYTGLVLKKKKDLTKSPINNLDLCRSFPSPCSCQLET